MAILRFPSILALAFATLATATASPPSRDTVVETQLLPRSVKAGMRTLFAAPPDARRFDQARRLIEAGRATGDPRTLGYAQALLAPWPAESDRAPPEALVLYATIAQSRHDFASARGLLDRVLRRSPADLQALLTRATVAQAIGDFAQAAADCARLAAASPAAAAICAASVDARTGHEARAIELLRAQADAPQHSLTGWAAAILGDVYAQRGEWSAAAQRYAQSLRAGEDLTTRLTLADVLLQQRALREAQSVLAHAPPTEGVLLRRWLVARELSAAGRMPVADADALREQLSRRFAIQRARGETLHARETAWFALESGAADEALREAQRNWAMQREPIDLWLLARAARAAHDADALARVRDWLARTRLADARVRKVLEGAS